MAGVTCCSQVSTARRRLLGVAVKVDYEISGITLRARLRYRKRCGTGGRELTSPGTDHSPGRINVMAGMLAL
eukprot:2159597-Rhodomonas_salina.1